jgi:kynurenine formamidase
VDLTCPYDENTIYWPTAPSTFEKETLFHGYTERGYSYSAFLISTPEHGGTHIDAASLDHGPSREFKAHRVLMEAGTPGFENVANLGQIPTRGVEILSLPMKSAGGSGGPLRIVARVPGTLCATRSTWDSHPRNAESTR